MAKNNNYYIWLKLPLDSFVSDTAKLNDCLDKCLTEWHSAKDNNLQQRAQLHETDIRRAISDDSQWKSIYNEAIGILRNDIERIVDFLKDEKNDITNDEFDGLVKDIQKRYNIASRDFVKSNLPKGITVGAVGNESGSKALSGKKLVDFKPDRIDAIKSVQTELEHANLADIFEFISAYSDAGLNPESTSKEEVCEALDDIKKRWRQKKNDAQKATVDKVTSGFKKYFSSNEVADYNRCISYIAMEKKLTEVKTTMVKFNSDQLSEDAYKKLIREIYEYIKNSDDAQSIVNNFCAANSIAYPQPASNTVRCIFCHNSIDKAAVEHGICPACRRSFAVVCPKCKKGKNLMRDNECCGINLQKYPYYEERIGKARVEIDNNNIKRAESFITEVEGEWPDFPGITDVKTKLSSLKRDLEPQLIKINNLINEDRFFTARKEIENIRVRFPKISDQYRHSVYQTCDEAQALFSQYLKETNPATKETIIFSILDLVTDYPEANAESARYSVKGMNTISAMANLEAHGITITWTSANQGNTADYCVIRKENTPVSNESDGVPVITTKGSSYCDTDVKEGIPYYFAVYAKKGRTKSAIVATSEPVILLNEVKVDLVSGNRFLALNWANSNNVIVKYSNTRLSSYNEGNSVQTTPTGARIDNLTNGNTYYILVYKHQSYSGKDFYSKITRIDGTPFEPITPPQITKSLGKNDGEYIISVTNPSANRKAVLYCDNSGLVIPSKNITADELNRKATRLDCSSLSDRKWSVNMLNRKPMTIFPVYVVDQNVIVGNKVELKYVKAGRIVASQPTGNGYYIKLDQWPEGANSIIVGLSTTAHPTSRDDSDRVIVVSKDVYNKNSGVIINDTGNELYYVSIIACIGLDKFVIANTEIDKAIPIEIKYIFLVDLLGRVTVKLTTTGKISGNLYFAVSQGATPLKKEAADTCITITPEEAEKKIIVIKDFKAKKGDYAKLFYDDKKSQLISGNKSPKLK